MTEAVTRGRPRDPRTDRDIMSATRLLLTRDGYDQVSIEAIAREAGVSRPTIYRRWPSKAHLVFDAAFERSPEVSSLEDSGDFDADLRVFVTAALAFWREPVVEAAALGVLAERHRDPQLHIRTQQLLDERTRAAFGVLVDSGIAQGAVDPAVDVDTLYQALIGSAFYAAQIGGGQPDDFAERLCTLVIQGARPISTARKAGER